MVDDLEERLQEAYHSAVYRYSYFLLAAAVVAISFAITQSRYNEISLSEIPLALAVGSWLGSFYAGCLHLENQAASLRLNALYIKARNAAVLNGDGDKALVDAEKAFRRAANRMTVYGRRQFRLLITGAIFYLTWHVLEMYLRTNGIIIT